MIEKITLPCPHCQGNNRFPVQRALQDLSKLTCGKCTGRLLRVSSEPLTDLQDADLAHPLDSEALVALRSLPRADELLGSVMKRTVDKVARFRHLGGSVQVDSQQLPGLFALHEKAAARLCIDTPPLFVAQSPLINAYTAGGGEPFIVLTSALVDALDDVGVSSVLGHELTHARLGHGLYRTLARLLVSGGVGLLDKLFSIGSLLIKPVEIALLRWYQYSELSADRGALLVTADLQAHIRTEMTVAGVPSRFAHEMSADAFLAQAERAEQMRDSDLLLNITDAVDGNSRTHPLPVWRAHHVAHWAASEAFFQVLAGAPRKKIGVAADQP